MSSASTVILSGSIILAVFLVASLLKKNATEGIRQFLFVGISVPVVFVTVFLAVDTIQENISSVTKGPVHWHAEFLLLECGQQIDLEEPTGLSNRIGTPVLHEHGDNWIHVEGTVHEYQDVSLASFFSVVGGQFTGTALTIPTDSGTAHIETGMECDGSTDTILQTFLYKTDDETKTITQEKLDDPATYILSPEAVVPPGDCIIIELAPEKDKTDEMCTQYRVAIERGDYEYINSN